MDSLVWRQVEVGPMANFAYIVGDKTTGKGLLVDPAWEPQRLMAEAKAEGLNELRIVLTHAHPDHMGGELMGVHIQGVEELLKENPLQVLVHPDETQPNGVVAAQIEPLADGQTLDLGELKVEVLHTPGHSPGSVCLLCQGRIITGDTLFIGACGRVDLMGGHPGKLFESLQRLKGLPEPTEVFPGHNYAPPQTTTTLKQELVSNPYLLFSAKESFLNAMGMPFSY